ncbi:hypothetical protein AB5I41_06045 [Sphingomonas sp. MMS24-JH45]
MLVETALTSVATGRTMQQIAENVSSPARRARAGSPPAMIVPGHDRPRAGDRRSGWRGRSANERLPNKLHDGAIAP